MRLRLQPIRVFCFHQVSEQYEEGVYCKPDWIPLAFLKSFVMQLQSEGCEFISLTEAYDKITNDKFRHRKYVALTADDGLLCQTDLLPWLEERHIPITLFVDLETLDGKTCTVPVKNFLKITDPLEEQMHAEQLYLTLNQVEKLASPILSIGMHGIKHEKVHGLSKEEFSEQVTSCEQVLSKHPAFIPYFAYPYGAHSSATDNVLYAKKMVPVLADGCVNYNDSNVIHREILEHIYQCQNHQS